MNCCYNTRVFFGTNPKQSSIDGYQNIFNNAKYIDSVKEGNNFEGVYRRPPNDEKQVQQLYTGIPERKRNNQYLKMLFTFATLEQYLLIMEQYE